MIIWTWFSCMSHSIQRHTDSNIVLSSIFTIAFYITMDVSPCFCYNCHATTDLTNIIPEEQIKNEAWFIFWMHPIYPLCSRKQQSVPNYPTPIGRASWKIHQLRGCLPIEFSQRQKYCKATTNFLYWTVKKIHWNSRRNNMEHNSRKY